MKKIFLSLALILVSALAACGKPPEVSSFATVEEQRAQGRANLNATAADYQRQNPRLLGYEVIIKADASHTAACPQGDGWGEVVFMKAERDQAGKLLTLDKSTVMCSTVSFNEGCVMVAPVNNWDKHPKKGMDGHCAPTSEVPMPLPKVVANKL